jgi:hypothetical protein
MDDDATQVTLASRSLEFTEELNLMQQKFEEELACESINKKHASNKNTMDIIKQLQETQITKAGIS